MMYSISGGASRQLTATDTALILAPPKRCVKYSGVFLSRKAIRLAGADAELDQALGDLLRLGVDLAVRPAPVAGGQREAIGRLGRPVSADVGQAGDVARLWFPNRRCP